MYRLPQAGMIAQELLAKKAEGTWVQLKQNNARAVDPWVVPNHLFSCCQQLRGKIHQGRTRSAPDTSGAEILYVLVWKGRRKILQTYHQMGLCQQEGAPFNAIIHWEGIEAVPASPTYRTTGSAAPACQKAKVQHANPPDTSQPLYKAGKKLIQEVMGVFLYLAWAVDSMMLTVLSALASKQAAPTEKTMQKCLHFLDCAASQEDAIVTYQTSDMRLAIHSNTLYLSEPKAQSRAGGHMFMAGTEDIPINNWAVLNILQIIRAVMWLAAKAKLGTLFINAKMAISMQRILKL
jgi:hypothetical protein